MKTFGDGPPPLGGAHKKIRVLVVDDSPVQRGMLMGLLEADPECEVVGWAADGAEAVRMAARLRPDVITMDLQMPRLNGIEAASQIMQETPTPIVMITASPTREDQEIVAAALQAGVLAIVAKPGAGYAARHEGDGVVRTVKSMAKVKVLRRWSPERMRGPNAAAATALAAPLRTPLRLPVTPLDIVVIGASTGGPQALQEILSYLPADFPLPVLVVQHIAPGFETGLVEWLRPQCRLPVQLAA
ncbi:MAG: response regulator, partial [Chloroflexi bacterium]|nr:response regulator [Chloroflexota bacterium]